MIVVIASVIAAQPVLPRTSVVVQHHTDLGRKEMGRLRVSCEGAMAQCAVSTISLRGVAQPWTFWSAAKFCF